VGSGKNAISPEAGNEKEELYKLSDYFRDSALFHFLSSGRMIGCAGNNDSYFSGLGYTGNRAGFFSVHYPVLLCILFLGLIITVSPVYASDAGETVIIAGGDSNFAPYEFLDYSGQPSGFNVELLRAVADEMGLNVTINLEPWHLARGRLEDGSIDMMTGMFYSEERDRVVNFSYPYIIVSQAIFVREGSDIKGVEDLYGKELIVENFDFLHDYAVSMNFSDKIITKDSQSEALFLLSSGKHDSALLTKLHGEEMINKYGISGIVTVGPPIEPREYCFAFSAENSDLIPLFNEGLAIVKKNGRYDDIYGKWFGAYEEKEFYSMLLNFVIFFLLPVIFLLVIALIWSLSLKREVLKKSAELKDELTKQREMRIALKESENKYYELFNNINEAVFLNEILPDNECSSFAEVNEAACRKLGYSREELLDLSVYDILKLPVQKCVAIQAEIAEKKDYASYYTEHIRKDGSVFPVHIKARLFELGGRKYILQLARDITEERDSRRRETDALKQIEHNLSQLAILNDEIRNPLGVIVGVADMNMDNSAEIIIDQANEIDKLIRKLDKGWLESAKIQEFLKKHLEIDDPETDNIKGD